MELLFRTQGDSSVGLGSDEATVITDTSIFDGDERKDYEKSIKDILTKAFAEIFGESVQCLVIENVDVKIHYLKSGTIDIQAGLSEANVLTDVSEVGAPYSVLLCWEGPDAKAHPFGDKQVAIEWAVKQVKRNYLEYQQYD